MPFPTLLLLNCRQSVVICLALLFALPLQAETACTPQSVSPRAELLARLALEEHREFNGHRIRADGILWQFGAVESENEALQGEAGAVVPDRMAWRRVWEYWHSLARHVPEQTDILPVKWLPGLLHQRESSAALQRVSLFALNAQLATLPPGSVQEALQQAAVRAALNDSAWSAAFISHLMDRAGLNEDEFHFSEAHAHYIKAAFDARRADAASLSDSTSLPLPSSPYAYRACDPRQTVPQTGDLLCYARGRSSSPPQLNRFADWEQATQNPDFFTKSHCELVVSHTPKTQRLMLVSGNVMQSVMLRELALDRHQRLHPRHFAPPLDNIPTPTSAPIPAPPKAEPPCTGAQLCPRQDFNRQRWAVLLQLQARPPLPDAGRVD